MKLIRYIKQSLRPHEAQKKFSIGRDKKDRAHRFVEEAKKMANDYKSLKLYSLYHQFGYKRRGGRNTEFINEMLIRNNLYCYPALTDSLHWKKTDLRIYRFPVQQLGDLFDDEDLLEKFIYKNKCLRQLGIVIVDDQHRPFGSSSILDFLGKDEKGNPVVVELKKKDGDGRGVQQVMRYKNDLQLKYPNKTIRKILITGIRDIDTAKSVLDLKPEDQKDFEWYLYNYNEQRQNLMFERVTNEFLVESFKYLRGA